MRGSRTRWTWRLSDFLQLVGNHNRILLGEHCALLRLEIVRARVLLGVAMCRAELARARARKRAGERQFFAAHIAAAAALLGRTRGRNSGGRGRRDTRGRGRLERERRRLLWCRTRGRRDDGRRRGDRRGRGRGALCLDVAVAFRAEILSGRVSASGRGEWARAKMQIDVDETCDVMPSGKVVDRTEKNRGISIREDIAKTQKWRPDAHTQRSHNHWRRASDRSSFRKTW